VASDFARTITPVVLTYNEAPNLARCLERLTWAGQVVVLDSGSTDDTRAIADGFPNVQVIVRPFDNHTAQWNAGLALVQTPWALALDADYVLPRDFLDRLPANPPDDVDAYAAAFRYCIFGRPLMGSLYPPREVLFRRERCRYEADGHTQRLHVAGRRADLDLVIDHDDRKPLGRWLSSQLAYARLEVEKLRAPGASLSAIDRLRRTMVFAPPAVFFYTLFMKGTILDGWRGWYYTLQRTVAEIILSLALVEARLRKND
jgi:glycosyltransferase involved in cell wall biosynthesis